MQPTSCVEAHDNLSMELMLQGGPLLQSLQSSGQGSSELKHLAECYLPTSMPRTCRPDNSADSRRLLTQLHRSLVQAMQLSLCPQNFISQKIVGGRFVASL